MQVTLTQQDIIKAMATYVAGMGISAPVQDVDIKVARKSDTNKYSAIVTVGEADLVKKPVAAAPAEKTFSEKPAVASKKEETPVEEEPVTETPEPETTDTEDGAPADQEPETEQETQEADAPAEEEEAASEEPAEKAAPKKSLFGS